MDCFDGYTAFYNQYYLANNTIEINNTYSNQCEWQCSNSILCGGFNFLHKQSKCILLITDSIFLSEIQQQPYSIFYMQSFSICEGDDFFTSPFYLVITIIIALILGICFWNACFRNNNRLMVHRSIYRHTNSQTNLIETPSPTQIPPPYQATDNQNQDQDIDQSHVSQPLFRPTTIEN